MTRLLRVAAFVAASVLVAHSAFAQPNTVNGRNIRLSQLSTMVSLDRTGVFPNGVNGFVQSTTICNNGTGNVPWSQAMNANHPFISFIVMRDANGRFEQISDRSFVKHGFFATNSTGCGTCIDPGTPSLLGVNCGDTYATSNNGDNYWLGPADEIDPWTGVWNPVCSHFDRGEPPVSPPNDCNGVRSLSTTQANNLLPVGHRIRVQDSDLNVAGATFAYQAMYTTQGEAEGNRSDNLGWRRVTCTWSAANNRWNLVSSGALNAGSILNSWIGATVDSNTNGVDDGRYYVGVKVTGPDDGIYHYVYAVHNRDASRGALALRIPTCPSALATNSYFHDIDQDGTNQWLFAQAPTELSFSTPNNFLRWNSVYTFAFDSDAAPVAGAVTLDQALAGAGAPTVSVNTLVPTGRHNVNLGPGCGSPAPVLFATGNPPRASLGNATFAIQVNHLQPSATAFILVGAIDATLPISGACSLYLDGIFLSTSLSADPSGTLILPAAIPSTPTLEGTHANVQVIGTHAGGALFGLYDMSNGLRIRIGDLISDCP